MSKQLVLSICIGKRYGKIGSLTLPTIEAYAKRIQADYLCIKDNAAENITPHFVKFQIHSLLDTYDRIIYIDADCLVRDDTPSLFEIVPADSLGAFNEAPFTQGRPESLMQAVQTYNITLSDEVTRTYKGQYYNTGVLVLSKCHQDLFTKPVVQHLIPFFEQSLLNARILAAGTKVKELDYEFNRMTCMDNLTGEDRHAAYILHYAGCPMPEKDFVVLIQEDLDIWKSHAPAYKFQHHTMIHVVGGLGDQVAVEPVVRRAIEKEWRDHDIHIMTHFPRVYSHAKEYENVTVHGLGVQFAANRAMRHVNTLADDKQPFSQFAFHGMMHPADYASILLFRKQMPHAEKTIKLKVGLHDAAELIDSVGIHQFFDFIVVHPGKGWNSKTFPTSFWITILEGIVVKGIPVAVIGNYMNEKQGVVDDLVIPAGVQDWRNRLSISALITLLSQARVLISNDSAPIHIAGAFENHIILIPSCKHPDQVMPYRHGKQDFKACSLYKKLIVDQFFESDINTETAKTTADIPTGVKYEDYLPEPAEVIAEACARYST